MAGNVARGLAKRKAEFEVSSAHEREGAMDESQVGEVPAQSHGKRNRKRKKRKGSKLEDPTAQSKGVLVESESEKLLDPNDEMDAVCENVTDKKKPKKKKRKKGKTQVGNDQLQNGSQEVREQNSEMVSTSVETKSEPKKERNKEGKSNGEIVEDEIGAPEMTELDNELGSSSSEKKSKNKEVSHRDIVQLESEFKDVKEPSAVRGTASDKKTSSYVVHVTRPEDVEKGREDLPIVMMEQEIMEAIQDNAVVIVCGETGCGKTTQVPQFLYEAGYGSGLDNERGGMIGVTQPRRVAVLGTARRVAHELNVQLGREVGFQVRHDRKLGEKSSIKFMTDGILLRELQGDFLLRKYSAIVLDEAHERSLNTDILIGMLSRVVPLRQKLYDQQANAQKKLNAGGGRTEPRDLVTPLKLVIMSATLRVEDFTANSRMFPTPPPVIRVPARQFPVSVHFSKKTELIDYMGAAYKKVCAIHRKLPAGGILVFLTGQREVEDLCKKLRKAFQPGRTKGARGAASDANDLKDVLEGEAVEGNTFGGLNMDKISVAMDEDSTVDGRRMSDEKEDGMSGDELFDNLSESGDESDLEVSDDEHLREEDILEKLRRKLYPTEAKVEIGPAVSGPHEQKDSSSLSFELKDLSKEESEPNLKSKDDKTKEPGPLHVLPLYAMLPAAAQLKVFSDMPEGRRFVVVATNVAETSITIPGIRYVVDCGRAKEKEFDRFSRISKFEVQWISKASADQRAGRAGRTGPGHCYRLYSSAHFNHSFPTFGRPEIHKSPIEGVVLVMKCMGIDKVANFPFPTPPDRAAVVEAEKCLKSLSALNLQTGLLTPMGQAMANYPISPRHSRMLLSAVQEAQELCLNVEEADVSLALAYAIAVAAALSLDDPFLREAGITEEEEAEAPTVEAVRHKNGAVASGTAPDEADVFHSNSEQQQDWMVAAEKARRKLRRAKAGLAHSKFKNMSSDAISVANALRAYDQAQNPEQFCQSHYLHSKTMSEMAKLRKQLWDLVMSNISDSKTKLGVTEVPKGGDLIWNGDLLAKSEACWHEPSEKKLNQQQEALIRQAICAGWADQVSRKLSLQERAAIPEARHKRKVVAYRGCSLEEPIFLHPTSVVCKEAPAFVVYNELVNTSRIYMQRVSAVEPTWLVRQAEALCTFSKPLSDPAPWYDQLGDEVMCWVTPNFGTHVWELPLHKMILKKGKHRTAVFASALLQGKVLPSFSSLHSCLTNDPNIILKPESQALKRVSDLLHRLNSSTVDTRASLRDCWTKDAHFLYPEIMSWVQSNYQVKVKDIWEQLRQESRMEGEELYRKSGR
ncbi:hypothetical protein Mapa_001944 [Marchantia paleacea]|nr:hypothetical protein Mapa_001944 [Marchantia paleacea]